MPETERALSGLRGVRSVKAAYLEGARGSVTIEYDPAVVTVDELVRATEKSNSEYIVTVGDPATVPPADTSVDYRVISSGGPFRLEESLAAGKATVVVFGDDGHRASQQLDSWITTLAKKHRAAVRKVHVGDPKGTSSAAEQMRRDFGADVIPYVRLYGKDGGFVRDWRNPSRDEVEEALRASR